jgi:hypothetical protein
MPTKSVMGHSGRSTVHSSRARARRSDLRFAAFISTGTIATVLTLGALLAPVLAWNGGVTRNAGAHDQTVRLPEPAPAAAGTQAIASPRSFAADRPGHRDAAAIVRRALRTGGAVTGDGTVRLDGGRITLDGKRVTRDGTLTPLANKSTDTDGDGLPDTWERRYGLNPNDAADATEDTDGDGLDNRTELRTHTAPTRADTDRNGVPDGDEDADRDGLRNLVEIEAGADPANPDSNHDGVSDDQDDPDGDGVTNIVEQEAGTNPGSNQDVPPVTTGDEPTPAVTPDDEGIVDDGTGGDTGTPPAPDTPDQPVDQPTPEPDHPVDPTPAPDQPADDGGQPVQTDDQGATPAQAPAGDDQGSAPVPTPATVPAADTTPVAAPAVPAAEAPASTEAPAEAAPAAPADDDVTPANAAVPARG